MIKPVTSVKVSGRRVIVRAGFDVPIENGQIVDDTRIKDALPTLNHLIKERAKIIIVADDITKQDLSSMSQDIPEGSILFLENIRFYPGNQGNDEKFIDTL